MLPRFTLVTKAPRWPPSVRLPPVTFNPNRQKQNIIIILLVLLFIAA